MKKFLFRFRPCNENNFNALRNAQIWCTSAENFADPRDCSLRIDVSRNVPQMRKVLKILGFQGFAPKWIEQFLSAKYHRTFEEDRKNLIKKYVEQELTGNISLDLNAFFGEEIGTEIKRSVNVCKAFYDYVMTDDDGMKLMLRSLQEVANESADKRRKLFYVCSFTETYKNDAMWESFADGFKGFCCRYDMDAIEIFGKISPFQKVIYGKKPVFDFTNFLKFDNSKNQLQIENEIMNQLVYKDNSMHYQREWRLFVKREEPSSPGKLVDFDICSGIILGIKISDENKRILLKIAEEKDLRVYEQRLSRYENFYYHRIR